LRLRHCINGFVDSRADLPSYGQLGCKGFIVLDPDHAVISHCTTSFMELRENAFLSVEAILSQRLKRKFGDFVEGDFVAVKGIASQPQLNGQTGVLRPYLEAKGRWQVELDSGELKSLKPSNLSALFRAGDSVTVKGIVSQPQLNGQTGVLRSFLEAKGRWQVELESGELKSLKPSNLKVMAMTEESVRVDATDDDVQADAPEAEEEPKPMTVFHVDSVDTVGVPSLDAEHEECITAMNKLSDTRKLEDLQATYRAISAHFKNEEELLVQHGFGANQPAQFSPLTSHVEDHTRILRLIEEEIERKQKACSTALACSVDFVKNLADAFHFHADKFDGQYSQLLMEAGVQ
jgi:hemerythrin